MSFSKRDYQDVVGEASYDNEQLQLAMGGNACAGEEEYTTTGRDRDASDEYYSVYQNMRAYCNQNSLLLLEKMSLGDLIRFMRN